MSLEIGEAISNGFEKLTTTAGLRLVALSIALSLVTNLGTNSVTAALDAGAGRGAGPVLVLPIGVAGGGVLALVGAIASLVLSLIIYRTMAYRPSELRSIPGDVTDSLLLPAIFLVITSIVVGVAVAIGLVLLVVPGIFLAVSFAFAQVYVAVENQGPFEAMSSSWSLASGNRLSIFLLGLVLVGIGLVVGLVGTALGFVSPLFGTLLSLLVTPFVSVFTSAVLVEAYLQLTRASNGDGDETASATTTV